jgi:predicted ATPase/class 3 adenylate cyclase/DNA-binding CsgD family transcriptional regulator
MPGVTLPTGTVTFLLTDIVGSTAAWEHDAEAMGEAVRRHYELIDEVVTERHGHRPTEQGEGDSTVSVFASASHAVRAAAALQARLATEPWPTEAPLRVRMAVHTGEAALRDDSNYMGPTLNRGARLRSCAHGGQVLLSAATAALVEGRLGDDLRLLDLGTHRLRDLTSPERVFQLAVGSMPSHFPAITSLDATLHNLPVAMSTFVGREDDLAKLAHLLGTERLITLVGAGGCGKTRLALHVGAEVADRFTDGVWLVELAPVSDPDQVVAALASALGVLDQPGRPVLEVVRDFLAERSMLLILDNCEHLLHASADAVGALLERCAGTRVLATSREPLSLPGEVTWRVPSLDLPADDVDAATAATSAAAVQLFVDRARSARPSFVLDASNDQFVMQICRRLDGIPLAIELAAARCRTMPVERIAAELDDRFRLLTGGSRTLLARQQTLLASVEWSNSLLDEHERRVLLRLAVFAGGFSLDAAEAVGAGPVPPDVVFDALSHLVDKSLVSFDDDTERYRVPETIRQFAFSRITPEELASARDAHCAWYVAWLESASREADGDQRSRTIRLDYTDLRAAAIWAMGDAQRTIAIARSRLPLALTTIGRSADAVELGQLALDGLASHDEWTRAQCTIGWLMARALAGDGAHVVSALPGALELARESGDLEMELEAHMVSALIGAPGSSIIRVRDRMLEADVALRTGPGIVLTAAATLVGTAEFGPAIDMAREPMRRNDMSQFRVLEAALRGVDAEWRGDIAAATRFWEQSLEMVDDLCSPSVAVSPIVGNAMLAARRGDAEAVDAHARLSRRLRRDWGGVSELVRTVEVLAAMLVGQPGPQLAYQFSVSAAARDAALVAMSQGHLDVAEDYARQSVPGLDALANEWSSRVVRAQIAHLRGAHADALEGYRSFLQARGEGHPGGITDVLGCLAPLSSPEDAARALGAADAWRAEVGFRWRLPHQRRWADDAERMARAALGDDRYAEACAAGAAVGWDGTAALLARRKTVRTTATSGWDSLTPAELDTVRHLARGLTNAQIAEAAFVSVATVKTHLHHVYRKLDLSSRAALASAATEHLAT